jgi:hypothetical protein
MPLFEAARHETLADAAWDEAAARAAIGRIVGDADDAFQGAEGLWPLHPFDRSEERPEVLTPLYYGAAGVIWALERLKAAGATAFDRDYRPAVRTLVERHRRDAMRLGGRRVPAFLVGEAGILMLHWTLEPSEALADQLAAAIDANQDDRTLGFAWGAPGAMLAALFMFERTREARWAALYRSLAEALWRAWEYDADLGCHLWTHDLYGHQEKQLGALHGFAGNAFVLTRGADLLGARADEARERIVQTFAATGLREGCLANWPLIAGPSEHPGVGPLRVQHCTGSPGMVNALAGLLRGPVVDELLLAAGELTWAAGPVAKLPGLCHGVAGSGYAFLKLHARTGDAVWLERARAFAMHGIEQARAGVERYGQRKFSVWTGDLGLALYLWDCIRGIGEFPMMDVF